MNLLFSGFEKPICLGKEHIAVLEVHNRILFAQICQSLLSYKGEHALEPYLFWKGESEFKPADVIKVVPDPFNLPWGERDFLTGVYSRLEVLVLENEVLRQEMEQFHREIEERILGLGLQLQSDYAFTVEWELRKYLKSFGFGVELNPEERLFDSLIKFIELAADVSYKKAFVFFNLKLFFSKKELEVLYEQAIFFGIPLFLVESAQSDVVLRNEQITVIDQQFLQY